MLQPLRGLRIFAYAHVPVSATDFEVGEITPWLFDPAIHHNASKPELLISGVLQLKTCYALQKKISAVDVLIWSYRLVSAVSF